MPAKKTRCIHGHPRMPDNVTANSQCLPCMRARRRRPEVKEHNREYSRRRRTADPEAARAVGRQCDQRLKLDALNHYGGPICVDCGEEDFKKLGLDHVNGDGGEHRRELATPHGGPSFYRALRSLGWPNDPPLQVLCTSCNSRKENEERKKISLPPVGLAS